MKVRGLVILVCMALTSVLLGACAVAQQDRAPRPASTKATGAPSAAERQKLLEAAQAWQNQGEAYLGEGKLEQAIAEFEQASAAFEQAAYMGYQGSVLAILAYCYSLTGRLDEASAAYEKAVPQLAKVDSVQYKRRAAMAAYSAAALELSRGQAERAKQFYAQAVALDSALGEDPFSGMAQYFASTYKTPLSTPRALAWWDAVAQVEKSFGSRERQALAEAQAARVYANQPGVAYSRSLTTNLSQRYERAADLAVGTPVEKRAVQWLRSAATGSYVKSDEQIRLLQKALELTIQQQDDLAEAAVQNDLATAYARADRLDEAIAAARRAVEIEQAHPDRKSELADRYVTLGALLQRKQDWAAAREIHLKALALCQERGKLEGQGRALRSLAVTYLAEGRTAEAQQHHRQGIALYEQSEQTEANQVLLAQYLFAIARDCFGTGNASLAQPYWERGEKLLQGLGKYEELGQQYYLLGNELTNKKPDYAMGAAFYRKAVEAYKTAGNKVYVASNLRQLAYCYRYLKEWDQARAANEEALKVYEELGNDLYVGRTLQSIGFDYASQNQYEQAIECYKKALVKLEAAKDSYYLPLTHYYLASAYGAGLGDYASAAAHYAEASKAYREAGNPEQAAAMASALASLRLEWGDIEGAVELWHEAASVPGATPSASHAYYLRVGDALMALGRYTEAVEAYEKAKGLSEPNPSTEASTASRVANAYLCAGKLDEAAEQYEKAAEIYMETPNMNAGRSVCFNGLAYIALKQGDREKALKHYRQALFEEATYHDRLSSIIRYWNTSVTGPVGRRISLEFYQRALEVEREFRELPLREAVFCAEIARILAVQGQEKEALEYYDVALRIEREHARSERLANILYELGLIYQGRGELEQAKAYLSESYDLYVELGPELREADEKLKVALALAHLYDALGDAEQAGKFEALARGDD